MGELNLGNPGLSVKMTINWCKDLVKIFCPIIYYIKASIIEEISFYIFLNNNFERRSMKKSSLVTYINSIYRALN